MYSDKEKRFASFVRGEVARLMPGMVAKYEEQWSSVDGVFTTRLSECAEAFREWGDPVERFIEGAIRKERSGAFEEGSMISTDRNDFYQMQLIKSVAAKAAKIAFLPRIEAEIKNRAN